MVRIHRSNKKRIPAITLPVILLFLFVVTAAWLYFTSPNEDQLGSSGLHEVKVEKDVVQDAKTDHSCPYRAFRDLTEEELRPRASANRHMVDPPADTEITLVCCQTTAGPWNIAVHHSWAPHGAQRFLDMVESHYFGDQEVPLMRCVPNFLCQFGLAGEASKQFKQSIPDDPNWLPQGPTNRFNELGVKRFQRGYFAYAGAGKNSRDNQLIVALKDNGPLAGGSPWEVPWGELVGNHSFVTLSKIYTGYGELGPKQGGLWKKGSVEKAKRDFPKLDFVLSCEVVDYEDDVGGEWA